MKQIIIDGMDDVEVTYHLREVLELSYEEIARFQGIPLGTVMSRIRRGRQRHGTRPDYKARSLRKSVAA